MYVSEKVWSSELKLTVMAGAPVQENEIETKQNKWGVRRDIRRGKM